MVSGCTAINLSDEQKCAHEASSANGLFCRFHAKQCYALYKGYKTRNARLDALNANPPDWLASSLSNTSLTNLTFDNVEKEKPLTDLHQFLYKKYALLDRIIRARKLHSKHFYPLDLDYGHKAYVDKLTNERFNTLRALERLEKRAAEVLYAKQKWLQWVKEQQDEEERSRESESVKIKREAQLFRRYMKDAEARLRRRRQKEHIRRQDTFLEEAYKQRQDSGEEDTDTEIWDPIEDEVEDDRNKFIDTLRSLLWLNSASYEGETVGEQDLTSNSQATAGAQIEDLQPADHETSAAQATSSKSLNRNQKKRAKKQAKASDPGSSDASGSKINGNDSAATRVEVNETAEQIRDRLLEGEEFDWRKNVKGGVFAGTIEHPVELHGKVLGLPPDEVEQLVRDLGEIKQLLLCRLLLSFPTLLRVALEAHDVQEFFENKELNATDLRDLCLRLERPSLQEIRDACADFARGDEDVNDGRDQSSDDEQDQQDQRTKRGKRGERGKLPDYWKSKHEQELYKSARLRDASEHDGDQLIDFGDLHGERDPRNTKMRIAVCGRKIWNYSSEQSMARGGWLHFSILARNTKLADAIELCRNWDEFFELNISVIYGYFPSTSWGQWAGDRARSQLLQLGFIPRYTFLDAHHIADVQRSKGIKGAGMVQFKNVICGHIRRNSPVSRRFVQYLNLFASELCLLVRDAKTGRIVVRPPEEHLWLNRERLNNGRTARGEWKVTSKIGEHLFEQMSDTQQFSDFRFSFLDHYDVIIWDRESGINSAQLQDRVQYCLIKAYRFKEGLDCYSVAEKTLKSLHRERDTMRCRDVRPGEDSVWDDLHHPESYQMNKVMSTRAGKSMPRDMTPEEVHDRYYNEVDVAEDEILFPEELEGRAIVAAGDHADRITRQLEQTGPNMTRFVNHLDTDDDTDDYEDFEELASARRETQRRSGPHQNGHKSKKQPKSRALKQKNARFNSRKSKQPSEDQQAKALAERLEAARLRDHNWQNDDEANSCGSEGDDDEWEDEEEIDEEVLEAYLNGDLDLGSDEEDVGDAELELVESDPLKLKKLKQFVFTDPSGEDTEKQFANFVDRERAKVFKPQWHASDFEPGAVERYAELQQLQQESRRVNAKSRYMKGKWMQMLCWLDCHMSEHRLVERDIMDTFAFVGLFFPGEKYGEHIAMWRRRLPGRTKLVDNEFKAGQLPYYRDWRSITTLPESFWPPARGFDAFRPPGKADPPREWDAITRPLIARLYKAGIIAPFFDADSEGAIGRAIAATDPMSGKETMFIDYRISGRTFVPEVHSRGIQDWRKIDLLDMSRDFHAKHNSSRFALLRVWSHSHFWPLMVGYDSRLACCFEDYQGRFWQWKFYPKEFHGNEWNMQETINLRLKRWSSQLDANVKLKRDIILVMGKDQEELEELVTATVFALHTAPWRLEVDFWRSFIDVDVPFLERLDSRWLE